MLGIHWAVLESLLGERRRVGKCAYNDVILLLYIDEPVGGRFIAVEDIQSVQVI